MGLEHFAEIRPQYECGTEHGEGPRSREAAPFRILLELLAALALVAWDMARLDRQPHFCTQMNDAGFQFDHVKSHVDEPKFPNINSTHYYVLINYTVQLYTSTADRCIQDVSLTRIPICISCFREMWPQLAANRAAWRETLRLGYPAIRQSKRIAQRPRAQIPAALMPRARRTPLADIGNACD